MIHTENKEKDFPLPPLRDGLRVVQTAPTYDGVPTWTIIDPVQNKFFQIGWPAYQLLSRWECGSARRLLEKALTETTCRATMKDVEDLAKFLYANNLTQDSATGDSRAYVEQAHARRQHWLPWLVHNYLFLRIPLVRPARFLKATLPFVAPFFTKTAGVLVVFLGMVGLYLVGRQWETFINTFPYFYNGEGLLSFGLALCVVKILHELGHAYTATRYGCRVPTMGVAFLVLFPVLYTDTTDAWRLRSRRQRLWVGASGITTELALAAIATFLWSFLPEGIPRSVAFVISTTSWVMALMINLNPLLRFDGYYILADWLGESNLQGRAFALGRWRLRQLLFATGEGPPENVSPSLQWKLIAYAWSVWVFRFFLFIGIALLVYYFFFKLLGLILFAVEILWFIVLPIAREVKEWWKMKGAITRTSRSWLSVSLLALLVILCLIPWSTRVSIPAVLEARQHATIFAPAPGRIMEVSAKEGQAVRRSDVLVILEAPSIEKDIELARKRIEVLQLRARRQAANPEELANNQVVLQALKTRVSELRGLMAERNNLVLTAPIQGVVTDLAEALHPGRWVNEKLALAYIVEPETAEIHALALETQLTRLTVGQAARFIPEDPTIPSIQAEVHEIRQVEEGSFEVPYLGSTFGGEIAVRKDERGRLVPETSVYRVTLKVLGTMPGLNQAMRGVIHVKGRAVSFAGRVLDLVAAVLIRESGF